MISRLLSPRQSERPSVSEILRHPWLTKEREDEKTKTTVADELLELSSGTDEVTASSSQECVCKCEKKAVLASS